MDEDVDRDPLVISGSSSRYFSEEDLLEVSASILDAALPPRLSPHHHLIDLAIERPDVPCDHVEAPLMHRRLDASKAIFPIQQDYILADETGLCRNCPRQNESWSGKSHGAGTRHQTGSRTGALK